jgi:hypothetical protein
MKRKHFHKTLRKYRRLQTRLAEAAGPKGFRHLFRKLDILQRRLLRLNRAWKLGLSTAALLAGMATPAQAQQFPASIDLDTLGSYGFVINGIDGSDRSGTSVSGVGDINGDGIDDLLIGANYARPNGNIYAGESYIVFGTATPPASIDLDTLGSHGFVINGIDAGDNSGISVSGAGDFNGDGIDDLLIGAFYADPNGNNIAGESYVVFGTATPPSSIDLDTLGSHGLVINGIDVGERSGYSVSGAGDVNGDGIDDLLIGANSADPNGNDNAGESYVVFGTATPPASLDLSTLNGSNGFVINGIDLYDGSGWPVSGAGDFNGDGFNDIIIGASYADPNGNDRAGESYLVFGTATPPASLDLSTLNGSNGFVINGIEAFDRSGGSVSGAGDVNGDGFDDVIIGAVFAGSGNDEVGGSYVVFGTATPPVSLDLSTLNGTNGFVIIGIDANDDSGHSVSGAGDVNGDGLDDLIIGAFGADPNDNSIAGESYVVFGANSFFAGSLSLSDINGSNGFVIQGIDVFDQSGRSVSGVGDLNGDGLDDLIIGAWLADPNGNSYAGESYVVFGANSFPAVLSLSALDGSNGLVIQGIDAYDNSGGSVSGAGDLNGDGLDDLIIGARSADPNGNSYAGESYVVFGQGMQTRVAEPFETLSLEVSPNPTAERVSLRSAHFAQAAQVEIRLFDLLGRSLPAPYTRVDQDRFELDLAPLPAGTYLLRVEASGQLGTTKLVKQ